MPASPYSSERLSAAVASARTLSEALTALGVDPGNAPRRKYLRARMRALRIDTFHLEREGTRWSREDLEAAVSAATSMNDVLRLLGLDTTGGQHTHITRAVRPVRHGTVLAGPPPPAGGRPHGRRLAEQPQGEPAPALPQLPLHDGHLPQAPPVSGRRYTVEVLGAAASQCHDIDEVITFLGTPPYKKLGRYLMRRFHHHGIDVSHFRSAGDQNPPSAARVREAVAASVSIAGTLRYLGRPDNSTQRRRLRGWIADAGADSSHFLGQGHHRGRPGPARARSAEAVLVKREDGGRTRTAVLRRCLVDMGVADVCAVCGTGPLWHGRPMTLEVDHVNGDRTDDRLSNLRLLCPNCHAVTGTWCRGGGGLRVVGTPVGEHR